jgi:hypothetical protein
MNEQKPFELKVLMKVGKTWVKTLPLQAGTASVSAVGKGGASLVLQFRILSHMASTAAEKIFIDRDFAREVQRLGQEQVKGWVGGGGGGQRPACSL